MKQTNKKSDENIFAILSKGFKTLKINANAGNKILALFYIFDELIRHQLGEKTTSQKTKGVRLAVFFSDVCQVIMRPNKTVLKSSKHQLTTEYRIY